MVLLKDVMTRNPVCVKPDDLVTHARSLFRKHGFRALPVVSGGRLVGIISRGDVMLVTSTKANLTVGGIMNPNVFTANPSDSIGEAAATIIKSGVRQLPVVSGGKLVGIISSMDILREFLRSGAGPSKERVSEVMTESVLYCEPDDDLHSIWNKMLVRGFTGLPVLEKGAVKGIVTRMDVLKHISGQIGRESGKPRTVKVRRIMKSPAITIRPIDRISRAAGILVENRIIRLPVVDDKHRLLGILDIEDVIRAYMS